MGRTIRILGLHGYGTSGAIFESQTATFRQHLNKGDPYNSGDKFEFDFVDGPFPSGPAAGIELFYNPPYYCFWPINHTLDDIAAGRKWLYDYIHKNGPYDGVIMFSQGCVLGSVTLLHHFKDTPTKPPPFKFAIFVCGGPPLKELEDNLGFTVPKEIWALDLASRKALAQRADTAAILARGSDRWQNDLQDLTDLTSEELAELIHGPIQMNIPTVHIVGAKDPRNFSGYQLHALSHPDVRKIYEHHGGHDIPRDVSTSTTIASLVRWVSSPLTAAKLGQNGA
ncbi:putative EF-hand calcium-binding domain protein [Talaromyces proteolyticus]|uniref:EF-hand calcium-binding domain protein n=1 Tax=Talaromyces proteolyticus TaxID=1131652 RepID=A0AAD4KIX4_9EURO|nr:putative EF-hand calcium-binding domain protein [Talaromyces proteolyticus]KAH8692600.1 putative EF-hand calcium-binding domain protein [Talaromyces proteolyticus]